MENNNNLEFVEDVTTEVMEVTQNQVQANVKGFGIAAGAIIGVAGVLAVQFAYKKIKKAKADKENVIQLETMNGEDTIDDYEDEYQE